MAQYSIEITASTRNTKALNVISELSGLSMEEIRQGMKNLPLVIRDSIPLSEAVSIERQLRRMGISTHVRKVDVMVESFDEEARNALKLREEEIIIIPETEIRELPFQAPEPPPPRVGRKLILTPAFLRSGALFLIVVMVVVLGVIYLFSYSATKRDETELGLSIDQWSHTVNQQEALLDKGLSSRQIMEKLDEIEGKVSRLLAILKSRKASVDLKERYNQARSQRKDMLKDLAFRRSLEDAGYPIHPTCLIDQGLVRGVSDLPDGTKLRIQLFAMSGNDPAHFTTQINEGIFHLALDPDQERTIYDARATVAPFSQQPASIQQWVQTKYMKGPEQSLLTQTPPILYPQHIPADTIPEVVSDKVLQQTPTADNARLSQKTEPPVLTQKTNLTPPANSRTAIPPTPLVSVTLSKDSLADAGILAALNKSLEQWSSDVKEAEGFIQTGQVNFLEALYQRLLSLEAQIDHMIQLLVTDGARNRGVMLREDVYGAAITVRQDLQSWHDDFKSRSNPLYLETALHREMASHGFAKVQVEVLRSDDDVFDVNIHALKPETSALFAAIAASVADEMKRTPVKLGKVRLFYAGRQMSWTSQHLQEAALALESPDGQRRCVEIMEKSAGKK
jgi:hypothetical protein